MELEDYSKYYIQGSDHYLIPKDDFIELFNEMINWKNEAKKLESQFENVKLEQTKKVFNAITNILNNGSCTYRYFIYNLLGFEPKDYADLIEGMNITNAIVDLEEQENKQKNFIKYLENEIKKEKENLEQICKIYKIPKENNSAYKFAYSCIEKMENILRKYKETIGVYDKLDENSINV